MSHNSDYSRLFVGGGYGLSIHEVATCLGTSSQDLGTLCKNPGINALSERKPTAYTGLDSGETQAKYGGNGALNFDAEAYGIFKPTKEVTYTNYSQSDAGTLKLMSYDYGLFSEAWHYVPPSSKYRLLDFDGYIRDGFAAYPTTASGRPYDTVVDFYATSDNYLHISATLRFSLSGADLVEDGVTAHGGLVGLQKLLAEGDTSPLNLDLRFGCIVRASNVSDRDNPLFFLYISADNLKNYRNEGVYHANIISSSAIITTSVTQLNTKIRLNEVIDVMPIIAKKKSDRWLIYGLGLDSYPIVHKSVKTTGHFYTNGGQITLTLLKQDNQFIFYIASSNHLGITYSSTSLTYDRLVFGRTPLAISGDSHTYERRLGVATFGTQDSSSGYWVLSKSSAGSLKASDINGFSVSIEPALRAGTLIVEPTSGSTSFTITVCVNAYAPLKGTATVNVASAQTGDTFNITLLQQSLNPETD